MDHMDNYTCVNPLNTFTPYVWFLIFLNLQSHNYNLFWRQREGERERERERAREREKERESEREKEAGLITNKRI